MSVWISDEKLLIFASLISPSKMILFEKKYQTFDTVFHHQMKHLEVRQKYSAARRIFNSLLSVSSGDETLHLMFDILHQELLDNSPFYLVGFYIFFNSDPLMFLRKFSFCCFIVYACKCTWIGQHFKETVFWVNITWSAMGKTKHSSWKGPLLITKGFVIVININIKFINYQPEQIVDMFGCHHWFCCKMMSGKKLQ